MKILFLAANPLSTSRLALEEEFHDLQQAVWSSRYRHLVTIEPILAVRPRDLQEALLRTEPNILHFAGHGTADGIVLSKDNSGAGQIASPKR